MCVCSVWKHSGEWSPSVSGGSWGTVQLCLEWMEVLGLSWCGGDPVAPVLCTSPAAWWGHWCGAIQQLPPGVIVVIHQTSTKLSFRLQGRHGRCFWISFLFMVRNHKVFLTLSREVGTEKGGLLTAPVTANKHPGTIRFASACPKLKTQVHATICLSFPSQFMI